MSPVLALIGLVVVTFLVFLGADRVLTHLSKRKGKK